MDRWKNLFEQLGQAEAARRDKQRQQAEADGTRQALAEWWSRTTDQVMQDLCEAASQKAQQLKAQAGSEVEVLPPRHAPRRDGSDSPFLTFVKLRFGSDSIYLYLHRVPGELPLIHLIHSASPPSPAGSASAGTAGGDSPPGPKPVLVSRPVCHVTQGEGGAYELRAADPEVPVEQASRLSIDEVVYQAFDYLLACIRHW